MSSETFSYRGSASEQFSAIALFAGVTAMCIFGVYGAVTQSVVAEGSGRPVGPLEHVLFGIMFGGVGGAFSYFLGLHCLRMRNERIVFENGYVSWFDSRGRLRVRAEESEITELNKRTIPLNHLKRYRIETTKGAIVFYNYIGRRSELERRVMKILRPAAAALPDRPQNFKWSGKTVFRYRHPALLVSGLIFAAFVVTADSMVLTGATKTNNTIPVFIGGSLLFLLVPYFLLGAFFFEKIEIKADQIIWTDRHGREKVRAHLNEVRSVDHLYDSEVSSARIYTDKGEIRVSSHLNGMPHLIRQLQELTGGPRD